MKKLLLSLLVLGFCFSAMAQVTTSRMTGIVLDSDGSGLPGATVQATHTPTGTEYGTITLPNGRYNLPNMKIGGPYTVTISFVGYQNVQYNDVFLTLGEDFVLDVNMQSDVTELAGITITDDAVFNSDRTGATTTIDNASLVKLPTISRSASDIYRLNPATDGNNSFAGRNDQFNNFSLDGSIFNNPFGLDAATPGGQTGAQPISLDAIDQIQVSLAPYDVTQSGFTGASVNAVTKSGTNRFKGTVFGFFRNDELTGSKLSGDDIVVPDLSQFQTGFSLGGPIIKDKLFFFANLEIERREDLGSNFVASRPGETGENVSRVEASDLDAVRSALASVGYETGEYEGYLHDTDNQKGIIKLDWNINQKHSLTATYNFLDASKDNPAHPSALGRRGPDATTLQFENSGYQINNVIHSGILELRSIFGNKFSNKLQVGFTAFRDSRDPFSVPAPVININRDGIRYIVAGHEPFSINNRLDQDVFQFTDNFDIYAGDHTITVGTSFEKFSFDNSFNLGVYDAPGYAGGTFGPGFESVQAFLDTVAAGGLNDELAFAQQVFDANTANNSWALAETNLGQWALYIQDKWAVNSKFTLTYGVRMDLPLYFDTSEKIEENIARKGGLVADGGTYDPSTVYFDQNGDQVTFDHTDLPRQRPLISPRVGFNYQLDDRTQIRGGSGLFTGRFPFVWIGNQVANPDWFFYNTTERDFKFPQVWRSNLGIDRSFGEGWVVSTDLLYTNDINSVLVRNFGRSLPSGRLPGVDNREVYTANDLANFTGFGFPIPVNAYVFTNSSQGRSINWSVEGKKSFGNGIYATLAYNFLDSKDVSSIEAEISSDAFDRNPSLGHVNNPQLAPSLYGNRHRFIGTANKTFKYGDKHATTISAVLEYAEGGRFSYTYSGDLNNDGSPLNDLLYIPTAAEIGQMNFAGVAPESQRLGLEAFISQDEYLSSRRGEYVEKYGILSPWYSRFDLRILQDYNVNENNIIQFSIDILNAGNLLNSNWGVRQIPANTQPIGVAGFDGNGEPIFSFDNSLQNTFVDDPSLLSRWQIQFGLRYIFN